MVRGISDLRRFSVAATDGNLGSVGVVCFDDRSWDVRYLVVDAGDWLTGRRVLVPPIAVQSSDPTTLHVSLGKQQLGTEPPNQARAGESADVHVQTATAVDTEHWWAGKKVLVSPAWLTDVVWDPSKALCCTATAIDDGSGPGRAATPSLDAVEHRPPAAKAPRGRTSRT